MQLQRLYRKSNYSQIQKIRDYKVAEPGASEVGSSAQDLAPASRTMALQL